MLINKEMYEITYKQVWRKRDDFLILEFAECFRDSRVINHETLYRANVNVFIILSERSVQSARAWSNPWNGSMRYLRTPIIVQCNDDTVSTQRIDLSTARLWYSRVFTRDGRDKNHAN